MDVEIMVEALPLLGVCNLCLNEDTVKSMIVSQKHNGTQELYSEMLLKCFSIDLALLDLGDTKRLICDSCIVKLRDAVSFREQVEASLKVLVQNVKSSVSEETKSAVKDIKSEDSTNEDAFCNDFDDFCDDEDNITLNEFKIKDKFMFYDDKGVKDEKPEKKVITDEKPVRKKKTVSTKRKLLKYTKTNDTSETEALLQAGLFPFRMRKNHAFSCMLCTVKSPSLDEIKKHVSVHSKNNIQLAFKKMVFSNSQRFYPTTNLFRCKICTTDIADFNELKVHVENCNQLKYNKNWSNLPFKLEKDQLDCPICKKTFLNYVSLNTHMNVHYPNYICESCGKAFASKARLRGHMRTHEVGSFPCRHCNAVFDRVTKRENHVSKEHKSGVRYACKRCNISLSSFYARQKHLAEVHNEELKRYKCKVCPQSYITPGHLSSHVRRDHLNERNHKCDKCDLAFYTKNALKMHMIKHDGERIHTCHICHKSYQRKKTLREHQRIHDNDKRFVCPVCGRAFTQKCTLKGHLKVHERKVDVEDRIIQRLI
ncbi:zinc finger and BTB domain-containing protein 41-like [Ostrinia nubilalis]|uniref:zinc finger and BTB domain-containing protein 41-like n=1 Tax=Ostrinia nubilalis TaxID=29057 RepID=UPI0030822C0C